MLEKLNFFNDAFIINESLGESGYIRCPDRTKNTTFNSPKKNKIPNNKKFFKRSFDFFKRIKKTLVFVTKSVIIFLLLNGGI